MPVASSDIAAAAVASTDAARVVGEELAARLRGRPLPLVAVQTGYSLLRGVVAPALWGAALAGLRGDARSGPWAALVDRDDLLGLPATCAAWGHERVAVGASVVLPAGRRWLLALILAPDRGAYARLCRLLSWRQEEPDAWQAWCLSDDAGGGAWDGLTVLLDDPAWAVRLRRGGAAVYWRSDVRPRRPAPGFIPLAAPLLTHLTPATRAVEPVLAAIAGRRTLDPRRPATGRGACLSELPRIVDAYRGFEDQLERGAALLARCRYVPGAPVDGQASVHLPPSHHRDADAVLRRLAAAGLCARYGDDPPPAARARLEHELAVIAGKRFAGYILTVHDLARGRRTCGRGSGAASIVCYCLGLTNVDPIRYRLVFERFLAPERTDPPDIDIDFPWDERDQVLAAALERYGRDRVAMVATHQTLSRRAALREAARAFGLGDAAIGAMRDRLDRHARFGEPLDEVEPWPAIRATAAAIVGVPRHRGLHCGGIVITAGPIRDLVPVHPAAKRLADGRAMPAISWEKDGAEAMGLVKIDLLGNRSLAVVRDCLADLRDAGIAIDEHRWRPPDDPATRSLVARGGTIGCFYIESPAMRQLQARCGSGSFDRLVVHSSIVRPAANRWIETYLARYHHHRCHGRMEDAWFVHPCLRELLSESYGVISYQEDVMLVAQRMAGFDSAGANKLRKALGKSDTRERLRALADDFHAGCRARGVDPVAADEVWGMISSFAGYSFCKAHSASYAMVSFQCAWLKAHHPAFFLARVIANGGGFYHPGAYVEEARRCGVAILPPCVQHGDWPTRAAGAGALRLGFHLIGGLAHAAVARIVAARRERPFVGVADLRRRTHLTAPELRALHAAGALDDLLADHDEAARAWLVAHACQRAASPRGRDGQATIALWETATDPVPPPLPSVPAHERDRRRFEALGGILCRAHPLTVLWDLPRRRLRCCDIKAHLRRKRVSLVVWCITAKQVEAVYDRDGEDERHEAMAFVTVEDETGLVETTWFPDTWRRYGRLMRYGVPLRLDGTVEVSFGFPTLAVRGVSPLDHD